MAATSNSEAVIDELCRYIAGALDQGLGADVTAKTQDHILDTFAAMVSGSRLDPGRMAIKYARTLGGAREALVVGTRLMTTAINAALANGMMAHADETDDSHLASRSHLGCSIVPGALAMAEKAGRGGKALLRAVALGYDVGARFNLALNLGGIDDYSLCTHSHGPGFGTAAAAAALAGATAADVRNVLAFSAQQASGLKIYMRDQDHLEKAFDFGGMPARNGVTSATMVAAGFTGVPDAICGKDGYLANYSDDPSPQELARGLGSRFEIMDTNIKKWSVGSPIQAALDSLEVLIAEHA
ncbi:MAG: MmgE/PrpD family protein, partial [Alphaproteobacteria bacterium]